MPDGTARPERPPLATRFTTRGLPNVAIFSVLYFVVVIAMLGIISPLVTLLTLPLSTVAAAWFDKVVPVRLDKVAGDRCQPSCQRRSLRLRDPANKNLDRSGRRSMLRHNPGHSTATTPP